MKRYKVSTEDGATFEVWCHTGEHKELVARYRDKGKALSLARRLTDAYDDVSVDKWKANLSEEW